MYIRGLRGSRNKNKLRKNNEKKNLVNNKIKNKIYKSYNDRCLQTLDIIIIIYYKYEGTR